MDPDITQVGVGIAVAVYLIKTVLDYVLKLTSKMKERNGNEGATPGSDTGRYPVITPQNVSDIFKGLGDIRTIVNDLHNWHDVKDEDHVYVWYNRKSLSDSIVKLGRAVDDLTRNVKTQVELLKKLCEAEDSHG
jgi:hypothetical protein